MYTCNTCRGAVDACVFVHVHVYIGCVPARGNVIVFWFDG